MKFIAAQRVRSAMEEGINAFLYEKSAEIIDTAFEHLDQEPGQLLRVSLDVPPSTNEILSILDLMAPSDVTSTEIEDALRQTKPERTEQQRVGRLSVRFRVLRPERPPEDELRMLGERAVAVLVEGKPSPAREPIVFEVQEGEDAFELTLTEASAERVRKAGGAAHGMQVAYDVASDIRTLHGPLLMHLAQASTSLSGQGLRSLGGVLFRRRPGGETIYEWPAPVE